MPAVLAIREDLSAGELRTLARREVKSLGFSGQRTLVRDWARPLRQAARKRRVLGIGIMAGTVAPTGGMVGDWRRA